MSFLFNKIVSRPGGTSVPSNTNNDDLTPPQGTINQSPIISPQTGGGGGGGGASVNGSAAASGVKSLRIAIIGQSVFAAEVLEKLLGQGFEVVGVFTITDKNGREDALATAAAQLSIPVFKVAAWRRKGELLPEVFAQYQSVGANLNVLPYCSQFIPMEVINHAAHGSICYHPSILPRHRGASAISWTLIEDDKEGGFSIFWADDGLDTGPILLQKSCAIDDTDTLDTFYKRFLYPEGVTAVVDSVQMIRDGTAPKVTQPEEGATYDAAMFKEENQILNLNQPARNIFNFIRALDSVPGALAFVETEQGEEVPIRLFGAQLHHGHVPQGEHLKLTGVSQPAIVADAGLFILGTDGKAVRVPRIKKGNKMMEAAKWFAMSNGQEAAEALELTDAEKELERKLTEMWAAILKVTIASDTDFFACGAGSMDVVRLIEEVKDEFEVSLENEALFMNPSFEEFLRQVVLTARSGGESNKEIRVDFQGFTMKANKREIPVPTQMFINGQFTDGRAERKLDIINPTTEEVICQVPVASREDVDVAIQAAHEAYANGAWNTMSARQRGALMMRLADLMERHKEELATIEAVDSGAVYTLALKTHVGMSIDVWRYFGGWADKIEGSTIPVTAARPNNVLTFTKKEPIGVVGLITPWNYPLMMLSWKMAAAIAAGNTVVIKPAQVCPLTALKFAELSAKAGFPPGVINVLPGTGSVTGQAIVEHPLVRKLGFTGSTEIGKQVMASCATSNLKKVSLELGGKSPLVIFADCDLDKAVRMGMSAVFFNKGENCIAAGRIFVEDKVHDEFVRRVLKDFKSLTIGDPLNRSTAHGPQNHKAHMDKLIEFCASGVKEGAKLLAGGKRATEKGYFFEPTVFTDVEDDMYIAKEESFGPIMIISRFSAG